MNGRSESIAKAQTPTPLRIDQAALTPIVRRSMNDTSFEITRWEYQQIYGGLSAGGAVHRFSGEGVNQDQKVPWSLILKTLHP